jgi:hypothetical protein
MTDEFATFVFNISEAYYHMETKDVLGMVLLYLESEGRIPDRDNVMLKELKDLRKKVKQLEAINKQLVLTKRN